ncbi:hypothetical protein GIV19_25095 [Pseudomonas syringae]|jgi:hypothetical protein|uniref:DUF6957 family protein n=1 Tax=Pseudomonas syringae TaxID=317 RepID=UPI001F211560|nr:hypothetical protein [Pseudomonas syringae]MCF5710527.1 hypothetical protein [Pseudomonas syringae]
MQDFDLTQMIGPSEVMRGAQMELQEAITVTEQRFPGISFCVLNEWVWVDFDAPDIVLDELSAQGKRPTMLIAFGVLFDSTINNSPHWFRSTPLMEFSDGMFFQTESKLYVLLQNGRKTSMPLSTLVRVF